MFLLQIRLQESLRTLELRLLLDFLMRKSRRWQEAEANDADAKAKEEVEKINSVINDFPNRKATEGIRRCFQWKRKSRLKLP